MWNLIFIVIAIVTSGIFTVTSLKIQGALTDLYKNVPGINPDFLEDQKKQIIFMVKIGLILCGMVIMSNLPIFGVAYSMGHGILIASGSVIHAILFAIIIKKIRA